ncbi:GSCOCG00004359001-RA-CDS, partial [Cotesia congregata]
NDQNVDDCQFRNFFRIINGNISSEKSSNGNNSYAIIILDSPFNLNERINVIHLATNTMNNYSNCYLFAPTALSLINQNNPLNATDQKFISLVTLVAPYKAEIVNHSAQIFKYDGVNYTLIIEDTNLNFEKAAVVFFKTYYRGSPLVCQKNNTNNYEQIGFFNIYLDIEKSLEQQRSELFINTTSVHKEIY